MLNVQQTSWRVYSPIALFSVNSLASMKSIYNNPKYWPTGCAGLTCNNKQTKYKTLAGVTWSWRHSTTPTR